LGLDEVRDEGGGRVVEKRRHRPGLLDLTLTEKDHAVAEKSGLTDVVRNEDHRFIETPEDVAHLDVRDPEKLAFVTQTTLSLDDTAEIVAALKKVEEMKAPTGETYGELISQGKLPVKFEDK